MNCQTFSPNPGMRGKSHHHHHIDSKDGKQRTKSKTFVTRLNLLTYDTVKYKVQ